MYFSMFYYLQNHSLFVEQSCHIIFLVFLLTFGLICKEITIWITDNAKTYIAILVKEYSSIVEPKTSGAIIFTIYD